MTVLPGTESATEGGPCQCGPCLKRAQKRSLRVWRWMRGLDLTKPPAPLIRWALLLILGLCCWAAGIPLVIQDWLGPITIAGALILPDVAGFGIAGMRLDLKQTQEELAALKVRVDTRQVQMGDVHIHGAEAGRILGRALVTALGEQAAKNAEVVLVDDETGKDVAS